MALQTRHPGGAPQVRCAVRRENVAYCAMRSLPHVQRAMRYPDSLSKRPHKAARVSVSHQHPGEAPQAQGLSHQRWARCYGPGDSRAIHQTSRGSPIPHRGTPADELRTPALPHPTTAFPVASPGYNGQPPVSITQRIAMLAHRLTKGRSESLPTSTPTPSYCEPVLQPASRSGSE